MAGTTNQSPESRDESNSLPHARPCLLAALGGCITDQASPEDTRSQADRVGDLAVPVLVSESAAESSAPRGLSRLAAMEGVAPSVTPADLPPRPDGILVVEAVDDMGRVWVHTGGQSSGESASGSPPASAFAVVPARPDLLAKLARAGTEDDASAKLAGLVGELLDGARLVPLPDRAGALPEARGRRGPPLGAVSTETLSSALSPTASYSQTDKDGADTAKDYDSGTASSEADAGTGDRAPTQTEGRASAGGDDDEPEEGGDDEDDPAPAGPLLVSVDVAIPDYLRPGAELCHHDCDCDDGEHCSSRCVSFLLLFGGFSLRIEICGAVFRFGAMAEPGVCRPGCRSVGGLCCHSHGICHPDGACHPCRNNDECALAMLDAGAVCYQGACQRCPAGATCCSDDSDCDGGRRCLQGICSQCVGDGDCAGWRCHNGTCVECLADTDCPGMAACDGQHNCIPVQCLTDQDCPGQSRCAWPTPANPFLPFHVCVQCRDDADCPPGRLLCDALQLQCVPGCRTDSHCARVAVRSLGGRSCVPSVCLRPPNQNVGQCIVHCATDPGGCIGQTTCDFDTGHCVPRGAVDGVWLNACGPNRPCPVGQTCKPGAAANPDVCLPDVAQWCTAPGCPQGWTCGSPCPQNTCPYLSCVDCHQCTCPKSAQNAVDPSCDKCTVHFPWCTSLSPGVGVCQECPVLPGQCPYGAPMCGPEEVADNGGPCLPGNVRCKPSCRQCWGPVNCPAAFPVCDGGRCKNVPPTCCIAGGDAYCDGSNRAGLPRHQEPAGSPRAGREHLLACSGLAGGCQCVSNVANLLRNDVTRAEVHRLCEANPQGILSIRCHDQEVDGWRFFLTPNDQDNGVDEMRGQRLGHDYHQNRLCAVERAANPADVLDYFYACSDWNL